MISQLGDEVFIDPSFAVRLPVEPQCIRDKSRAKRCFRCVSLYRVQPVPTGRRLDEFSCSRHRLELAWAGIEAAVAAVVARLRVQLNR